jgi:hypothetical protein
MSAILDDSHGEMQSLICLFFDSKIGSAGNKLDTPTDAASLESFVGREKANWRE